MIKYIKHFGTPLKIYTFIYVHTIVKGEKTVRDRLVTTFLILILMMSMVFVWINRVSAETKDVEIEMLKQMLEEIERKRYASILQNLQAELLYKPQKYLFNAFFAYKITFYINNAMCYYSTHDQVVQMQRNPKNTKQTIFTQITSKHSNESKTKTCHG